MKAAAESVSEEKVDIFLFSICTGHKWVSWKYGKELICLSVIFYWSGAKLSARSPSKHNVIYPESPPVGTMHHLLLNYESTQSNLNENTLVSKHSIENRPLSIDDNNLWHSSPVGTRPLSCEPGRCWCWFPEIRRGRFHQPEREIAERHPSLTRAMTENANALDGSDWEHSIEAAITTQTRGMAEHW